MQRKLTMLIAVRSMIEDVADGACDPIGEGSGDSTGDWRIWRVEALGVALRRPWIWMPLGGALRGGLVSKDRNGGTECAGDCAGVVDDEACCCAEVGDCAEAFAAASRASRF